MECVFYIFGNCAWTADNDDRFGLSEARRLAVWLGRELDPTSIIVAANPPAKPDAESASG